MLMPSYEYRVVPAPTKGKKAKGTKTPEGRFALSVEASLNEMGALGWEYLRAELLPSEERSGLTGSTTNWRNVLVFRRPLERDAVDFHPPLQETPGAVASAVVAAPSVIAADPAETPRLVADTSTEPGPDKETNMREAAETDDGSSADGMNDEDSNEHEKDSEAQALIRGMREQG